MGMTDAFIQELEQEAATTRRVLERVPMDKLEWRPHAKSMSLGALAMHLAGNSGAVAELIGPDEVEMSGMPTPGMPASTEELLSTHDEATNRAKAYLAGLGDAELMATWRVTQDGATLMEAPRVGIVRGILLNHGYHHRGQLTVYLRMLDVPLPSVYGPSADENPWG